MKLMENPSLLEQFRAGNPDALEKVYLHYAPQLYAHLRRGFSFSSKDKWFRVIGITDPVEQENLVQETFIRCFAPKARAQYDSKRPYFPYLQTTCQRLFIGQKRSEKQLVEFSPDDPNSEPSNSEQSQQQQVETKELLQLLKEYIETCEEREKEVFHAIFTHEESQQQVATRLGIGRMQVRTSLQKIRRGLLHHFRQTGYLQQLETMQNHHISHVLCWLLCSPFSSE